MDKIEYWVQIIREYILNNNLNVDKATFLTIVIGQITIYGILLTFYQFVASYQGSEIGINRYLGINIKEFFVKKKIKVFNNELSHKVQNQDDIKGIVRNAFIARNMNVDEYIDMIERECSICRSEINYVQKEKMKEYLLKTF